MKHAAVKLDGVVYVVDATIGRTHYDALWKGIRTISGVTEADHGPRGLQGEPRRRRDEVAAKIDRGDIDCVFGFAEMDGSDFAATDAQQARKRMHTK